MSIALLSAVEQLALLRAEKVSVPELVEEHLERIERLNPILNAFVDFDPDRVRAQARIPKVGRLAGLPVTVKSSIEVAGHRCEIGSTLLRGDRAERDADAVAALRDEGAIVLGTTNCPELLMAYETTNDLTGQTNNPWDLERSAGGSSGGESAAIAAGLSAGGIGSDSGGSVREPAHFTGICALKPTPGRISPAGHRPPNLGPFSSLGALGPMARTMADVQLLFEVLSRSSGRTVAAPAPYRPVTLTEAQQVTIGWFEDDGLAPVTVETRAAVRAAAKSLEDRGFRVKRYRPEGLEELRKLWRIFFMQCGALFYEPTIAGHRDSLTSMFSDFLLDASAEPPLNAAGLLQAWAGMDQWRGRFFEETREYPLLLMPVCSVPAFRHGERSWSIDGQEVGYWDAMRYTQWFNVLAAPAAVVPVGRSAEGLPIGIQLAGRPYQDELVLRVATVLDQTFGYRVPTNA